MSDLICRKSMMRCQTPGMCSPHGGCGPSVLLEANTRYSNISAGEGADWTDERKLALTTALRLVVAEEENTKLNTANFDLAATLDAAKGEIARLKAECEGLREVMACVVSEIPRGYIQKSQAVPV